MKRSVKWIAFAVAFITVFMLHVEVAPLKERAIVVALGIDYEEGALIVSAEILRPSDDQSKSAGYILVSTEARTVSEGLDNITKETASVSALSHCDLVVLGKGVTDYDAYGTVDYVFRNAYLSENAIIMTTDGTAKDILDAKTPYADTGAFYVEQANEAYGRSRWLVRRNVKDYVASYYTHNGGNWLTEVTKTESEKPKQSDGASSSGGGDEDKEYAFSYDSTAIFVKNKKVLTLGVRGTSGINLISAKLERGSVTVGESDGTKVGFYIASSECKRKFDTRALIASYDIKVKLVLKEILKEGGAALYTPDVEPTAEVTALVREELAGCVREAFEKCRAVGADIYDVYGGFYGKSGKSVPIPDDYLEKTTLSVNIEVSYV